MDENNSSLLSGAFESLLNGDEEKCDNNLQEWITQQLSDAITAIRSGKENE